MLFILLANQPKPSAPLAATGAVGGRVLVMQETSCIPATHPILGKGDRLWFRLERNQAHTDPYRGTESRHLAQE